MHTDVGVALKYNFVLCCISLIKYTFSPITLLLLNLYNRIPKIFAFDIFGLKCGFYPCLLC